MAAVACFDWGEVRAGVQAQMAQHYVVQACPQPAPGPEHCAQPYRGMALVLQAHLPGPDGVERPLFPHDPALQAQAEAHARAQRARRQAGAADPMLDAEAAQFWIAHHPGCRGVPLKSLVGAAAAFEYEWRRVPPPRCDASPP